MNKCEIRFETKPGETEQENARAACNFAGKGPAAARKHLILLSARYIPVKRGIRFSEKADNASPWPFRTMNIIS